MKDFYLIRHAKSSWDDAGELADINRPLALRGVNDAIKMSKRLASLGVRFDQIYASSGIRALHTAIIFARSLGVEDDKIAVKSELYLPSRNELLTTLQGVANQHNCVAIFAHDPGITDFAFVTQARLDHVATTGIVHYQLDSLSWKDAQFENLLFKSYDFPKNTAR